VDEQTEYTAADMEKLGRKWLERIRLSEKREEEWAESAKVAECAFLAGQNGDKKDAPEFNIVHSNVETIVPAVYNSAGKPDIRPRHNNRDPAAKAVSDILERAIMTMVDDSRMAAEVEGSAQDVFMAGRGVVRVKFDADVIDQPVMDPRTGQPPMRPVINEFTGQASMQPVIDPKTGMPPTQKVVTNEHVKYEVVSWRDFRMGPASRWDEVPWVAFRHCISQEAIDDMQDEALDALQPKPENAVKSEQDEDTHVWEIWCRDTGNVYKIVDDSQKVLSIKPDPLGLTGFFPCAAPVQPITATGNLTPVCPYVVYKALAEELDQITIRIRKLTDVLKAKGAIAGDTGDLQSLADASDGEIVPLAEMENIMAQGGLEKAIMWWPIDRIIQVIRELNAQREETKQAIYEITGISDILRGQTAASETLGAQEIKTQWGALRIKKMQRLIERQVRELFILTAEIISSKFSPETLQKLAGMEIPPEAMQLLQAPLDHYRIDVESDSTVRADLEAGRREMAEFLTGTANFFGAMAPIVAQAPQTAGPVVEMYASFARQFNLGRQAEEALEKFAQIAQEAAQNPPPNPAAEAAQAEAQTKQAEMQARMQEKQADIGMKREELSLKAQQMQADLAMKQVELQIKQVELEIKREELQLKEAVATTQAAATMLDLEIKDKPPEPAMNGV
jgi:hypothetical protein